MEKGGFCRGWYRDEVIAGWMNNTADYWGGIYIRKRFLYNNMDR